MIAELVFGGVALVATSAGWLAAYRARGETLACRDLLDAKDELADQYQHERDVAVAERDVKSAQLDEAKQRLASAEARANKAEREAQDNFVKRAEESNADEDPVSDLLAEPWPTVHGLQPSEADDNTGSGNRLIDPAKM